MLEIIGGFFLTVIVFILCVAGFPYLKSYQKREPLPRIKYYALQIGLMFGALLSLLVFLDVVTVAPRIIKGDNDTITGACSIYYYEDTKNASLDILFFSSEDLFFSVSPKGWEIGSLDKAYCEVNYYEGSDFGVHYKIYDERGGILLQED